MANNVHDNVFICPKCTNKTLVPIDELDMIGIGYGDLCICEECGAELKARPNYDYTVNFFEDEEE